MAELTTTNKNKKGKDAVFKATKKISEEAKINEAYFVGLVWNSPMESYSRYANEIKPSHFIHDVWKFFYDLGLELYKKGVEKYDDITVLKNVKSLGLEEKFEKYGGMTTIEESIDIVSENEANIEYYGSNITKNFALRELYKLYGDKVFLDNGNYKHQKMSADEILSYWRDKINKLDLEMSADKVEVENLAISGEEFLLKLEQDADEMLPFHNSPLLTGITQGVARGHVTMIGGHGNSGKSTFTASKFTMSCIANQEPMIIVLNEEDAQAYRQKILLNIMYEEKIELDRKKIVRNELTEKDRKNIIRCFDRLNEYLEGDEALIKIIFMEKYKMVDLEKNIRYWANRGYYNLLIDTHKVSEDSPHNARWETFVEDMKTIYRLTRKNAGGLNLRTVVTFQLADNSIRNRFLDFEAIGEGKAAKNEASTVMMFRSMWSDEYAEGSNAIECYRYVPKSDGKGYERKKIILDDPRDSYYLLFTPKNRTGETNMTGQDVLVLKPFFNTCTFQEIGWCKIKDDRGVRR